jgi:hypothetical protein
LFWDLILELKSFSSINFSASSLIGTLENKYLFLYTIPESVYLLIVSIEIPKDLAASKIVLKDLINWNYPTSYILLEFN